MKTRDSGSDLTQLPPPPAPPARDANPWQMPDTAGQGAAPRAHPRLGQRTQDPAEPAPAPAGKSSLPGAAVTIAIALFVLGVALLRFLKEGDTEALPGLAFAVVMLVFFAFSRLRRGSRASRRKRQARRD